MITRESLDEAIAEMNGQRNPDANTCLKLASYYTIKDKLFPDREQPTIEAYSYTPPPPDDRISYTSGTDFGQRVSGKASADVLRRIDEVLSSLYVINPPLYNRIIREMEDI